MVPQRYIEEWNDFVPWPEPRQVEQDLILCRAMVDIFSDPFLRDSLRIRGGTALNRLHFKTPLRYSEDIDLVRTTLGPIKPIIRGLRQVLEPWLGPASYKSSPVAPKLRFRVPVEGNPTANIRIKIEINTNEIKPFDPPLTARFVFESEWEGGGAADVETFSREEMLATKLRALLQRNKARDLFDLDRGLDLFEDLNTEKILAGLRFYSDRSGSQISRAEAERRMFWKLANDDFVNDIWPLLSAFEAEQLTPETSKIAVARVLSKLIALMPGKPWAKFSKSIERFGMADYLER